MVDCVAVGKVLQRYLDGATDPETTTLVGTHLGPSPTALTRGEAGNEPDPPPPQRLPAQNRDGGSWYGAGGVERSDHR